jgi:DNA-binding response OmpR family regulator
MFRILVIEDDANVRTNLEDLLEAENYEVLLAENGPWGVELALSDPPDLILCDRMMPELNGEGVLQKIRDNPLVADTPFVFLTALTDRTEQREGMNLGADDYIAKPFTREEILTCIQAQLAKHFAKKSRLEEREKENLEALREQMLKELPDDLLAPFNGAIGSLVLLLGEETEPWKQQALSEAFDSVMLALARIQKRLASVGRQLR